MIGQPTPSSVGTEAEPGVASVVIIDDTPDIRLLLTVALSRHAGFRVVGEAADGQEGIELVARLQPDAAVLDIAMPTLDGLRALPLMREASPGTAVVVLSGFGAAQMGAAALAAGAAAYVQKGTSLLEIADVVAGCVGMDPAQLAAPAPVAPQLPVRRDGPRPGPDATSDRYRQLIDQAVDHGLAAMSRDGRIETWNAGAERITGYPADEVIGHEVSVLYPDAADADRGPRQLMAEADAAGRATDSRWLVARDGTRRWVEMTLTGLRDGSGEAAGFALEVHDRTEDRRLEQAQASLFATVSHDLRSPINAIRAFASLLGNVSARDQATFAERIDANAEQLQRLVDSLFDYAKLRAGAASVLPEPIDLREFVLHRIDNVSAMLAPFTVNVGEGDFVAMADRDALSRVLDNVLSNACKYSPSGTRLSIEFTRSSDRVGFVLTDQGRGIDPTDLPRIFDEFVRGRLAQDDGGTGLGLASVRHLMSLQGGTVRIESELGVGTVVTVELPPAALRTVTVEHTL